MRKASVFGFAAAIVVAAIVGGGCEKRDKVLASVGEEVLLESEVERYFKEVKPSLPKSMDKEFAAIKFKEQISIGFVDTMTKAEYAKKLGYTMTAEEVAAGEARIYARAKSEGAVFNSIDEMYAQSPVGKSFARRIFPSAELVTKMTKAEYEKSDKSLPPAEFKRELGSKAREAIEYFIDPDLEQPPKLEF